jgi:phosphatidylserine decarboxylase
VKQSFNARKEGQFYVWFFLGAAVLITGILWSSPVIALGFAAVPLALAAFTMYFFRDPERAISDAPGDIVSPADGTVVGVEDLESTPHYDGPCKRISIFLSVFNVHINRCPFEAAVEHIVYKPGRFRNAMRADTTDVNESNTIRLATPCGPMTVRQISGLVARRIVCRCEVGERLARGERFGMIKFGSRTELYLPPDARICVKLRDRVAGGATVIAQCVVPREPAAKAADTSMQRI